MLPRKISGLAERILLIIVPLVLASHTASTLVISTASVSRLSAQVGKFACGVKKITAASITSQRAVIKRIRFSKGATQSRLRANRQPNIIELAVIAGSTRYNTILPYGKGSQ